MDSMTLRLRLTRPALQTLLEKVDWGRARLDWRTRFFYKLGGTTHSLLVKLQQAAYADALKRAEPSAPLFLLGFWRSGTTFLHELFCCDRRFGFPSTYACLNPSHFLLTESSIRERAAQRQAHRLMDNMRYSWRSPQEDEFALLALGAPSPYEALLVPSLMSDPRSLLDLRGRRAEAQNRWTETLLQFLRLLTVQQSKIMVLKSPSHGFKLPVLSSMFPQARYVVIDRNPYEVFASNLKLWRTLLEMYSWEFYSSDEIEAFVLAAYVIHEEIIAEGAGHIRAGFLARVRYEDLVNDPVGQMERLYSELGIHDFKAARSGVEEHVAAVYGHERNRFLLLPAQKARVDEQWRTVIQQKGYSQLGDYVSLAG
jgi:hypothetical protein